MHAERSAPTAVRCDRGVIVSGVGAISGDLECTVERITSDQVRVLVAYQGAVEQYEADGSPLITDRELPAVLDAVLALLRSPMRRNASGNPVRITLAELSWKG